MKRFCGFLSVLLAFAFLSSCASNSQASNDPWIGATKDQLVKQFGTTPAITSDNQGGEIWVYTKTKTVEGHAYGSSGGGGAMTQNQVWIMDKFFIDANGIIYKHQQAQI